MTLRQIALLVVLFSCLSLISIGYSLESKSGQVSVERSLFPIMKDGKYGFIDVQGDIVIAPMYHYASDFHEGVAAVRRDGYYGYIDTAGAFISEEKFDYAERFINGTARVYIQERPYYINRKGELLFEHQFKELTGFGSQHYAVAETYSGKICLLDSKGRMLTDTIYRSINEFSDGFACAFVLTSYESDQVPQWDTNYTACVIDTNGRICVQPGHYSRIDRFSEGKAHAVRLKKNARGAREEIESVFIDRNGKKLFSVLNAGYTVGSHPAFSDNKLVVSILDTVSDKLFPGVIDVHGNLLFADSNFSEITPYYQGVAFAYTHTYGAWSFWMMIDASGKQLIKKIFTKVDFSSHAYGEHRVPFRNGRAMVKDEEHWYMIGTSGYPIETYATGKSFWDVEARSDSAILFRDTASSLWFADRSSPALKNYVWIDPATINDALVRVVFPDKDNCWGYVNRSGEEVWRSFTDETRSLQPLNIDFMNRGGFEAASFHPELREGGWWMSLNYYRSLDTAAFCFSPARFTLWVDTSSWCTYAPGVAGYRTFIINDSKDTLLFDAQDSYLDLKLQARDQAGEWKDIEYRPPSWCGNSYHSVFLPPQHYWESVIPCYEGAQRTKLRAVLSDGRKVSQKDDIVLYSNEIDGSINPAQFWRKREYFPYNVMDPYAQ
jgi:hypothetical protein